MHPRTLALFSLLLPAAASAAEVQFEGGYRARGRLYDSLSLISTDDATNAEGLTFYGDHRLWLRPKFLLSDQASVTVDIRGLDGVYWGQDPQEGFDSATDSLVYYDTLTAPVSESDPSMALRDITLWRAYGDIYTDIGRFSFGRMPLHWGIGMWQNDGLGLNAEHGDTVDRLQWEYLVQDQFFIRAAVDVRAENFVNTPDDETAYSLAVAFRNESVTGGLQAHYLRAQRVNTDNPLNLFTLDGAADASLGNLDVKAEVVGQFGSGDLNENINNVNITAIGAVLDAQLQANEWRFGVQGGLATGDGDDTDSKLGTFTFDRDFNVGLMLFERPMPTLAAGVSSTANGNRDYDTVLTGGAVSNALYLKPRVARTIVDGLDIEATFLAARIAKLPESVDPNGNRRSYGMEAGLGVIYTAIEHVEIDGRAGLFLPGSYYKEYSDDDFADGFDRPAFGAQLTTRVKF